MSLLTAPAMLPPIAPRPESSKKRNVDAAVSRRYVVHGVPIELSGAWDLLDPHVDAWLGRFALAQSTADHHTAALPVSGQLRRYEQREVMRHLSPKAVRLAHPGRETAGLMELYQEAERFWLLDDRWGMAEMNLLKGSWRSWLLPQPTLDPARCAEMALFWPMAQILRGRGLTLLPAVSVARDGWGVLILSAVGLEAELTSLVRGGFRLLGQQWSCLRESGASVDLLHVPGRVQRSRVPALLGAGGAPADAEWVDLEGEFCGSSQASARCQAVVIIEPARRAVTRATELTGTPALDALRRGWPMAELHRNRRQLLTKLAMGGRCAAVQLARQPDDLLSLLSRMQAGPRAEAEPSGSLAARGPRRFVPAMVRR